MFTRTSPRGKPLFRAVFRSLVIRADLAGGVAVRRPTGRNTGRAAEVKGLATGAGDGRALVPLNTGLCAGASRGFFKGIGYERGSIGRCIIKSFDSSPSRIYGLLKLSLGFP